MMVTLENIDKIRTIYNRSVFIQEYDLRNIQYIRVY
jgi:hypothetical protein